MGEFNTAVPTAASVKFDYYNRSSVVLLIFGIYAAFLLCVDEAIEHYVGSGLHSVFFYCFLFPGNPAGSTSIPFGAILTRKCFSRNVGIYPNNFREKPKTSNAEKWCLEVSKGFQEN